MFDVIFKSAEHRVKTNDFLRLKRSLPLTECNLVDNTNQRSSFGISFQALPILLLTSFFLIDLVIYFS